MSNGTNSPEEMTQSQKAFAEAAEPVQRLIRQVLTDERQVVHLKTRPDIHKKILDHVRGIVRADP